MQSTVTAGDRGEDHWTGEGKDR